MTQRATVLLGGILTAAIVVVLVVIALLGRGPGDRPAATASATSGTAPATADPATDASCAAELRITASWPGGFGAELVVTAASAAPDWRLSWTLSDGATVTEAWGSTLVSGGADGLPVQVTAPDWAPDLAAGQSATVGFNGERDTTSEPTLVGASLNGLECGDTVPATAPVSTSGFYVDPDSQAARAAATATGDDRAVFQRIASTPQGFWVTDADPGAAARQVADYTAAARSAGQTGLLVLYAIPGRDCGAYSAGGTPTDAYRDWVSGVADAVVGEPWVVLEPDALADLGSCDGQGDRVGMLRDAAALLDAAGARVYLDAGHSGWLPAEDAADRINQVGTAHLTGFALNVSNYHTTAESVRYGEVVSQLTGDLGYVIDTSRNGNGNPDGEWCNLRGRALGDDPRPVDDDTALDALLWIKNPGESDGTCGGGPEAGQWWPEIARELVAGTEGQ